MSFIESCLGEGGLLNGQSFDLHYSSFPRTLETTHLIARGKTVSLIRLTLVLPAMLGGTSTREMPQFERGRVLIGDIRKPGSNGALEISRCGVLTTANGFEDGGVFMPISSAQSFS